MIKDVALTVIAMSLFLISLELNNTRHAIQSLDFDLHQINLTLIKK